MAQIANHQRENDANKAAKMVKLIENDLFQELILKDFIEKGIIEISVNSNLDNTHTVDELKARQILHKYLFQTITNGKISGL